MEMRPIGIQGAPFARTVVAAHDRVTFLVAMYRDRSPSVQISTMAPGAHTFTYLSPDEALVLANTLRDAAHAALEEAPC